MNFADGEVDSAFRLFRETFFKKLAERDDEIARLRAELRQKEAIISDLQRKVTVLEAENSEVLAREEEVNRMAAKLESVKRNLLQSLEYESQLQMQTSTNKAHAGPNGTDAYGEQGFLRDDYNSHPNSNQSYQRGKLHLATNPSENASASASRFAQRESLVTQASLLSTGSISGLDSHLRSHPSSSSSGLSFSQAEPSISTASFRARSVKPNASSSSRQTVLSADPPSSLGGLSGDVGVTHLDERQHTVDGRDFFKLARARLSYDEFSTLLWNVKLYNNREQSSVRVLENLRDLLMDKHPDLFSKFEQLLNGARGS